MKISSIFVVAVFALLTFVLWARLNVHTETGAWPQGRYGGFSFHPFRADQDATLDEWPTEEQIDQDLALVATRVINIRTYSSRGTLASIPRLAAKHRLRVAAGAYLYAVTDEANRALNETEMAGVVKLANEHENVNRVIVGNETLYRRDMSEQELGVLLDRVRKQTRKPVSTAEQWDIWLKHPKLADHVDYLAVHFLPYWESMSVDDAIKHIVIQMEALKATFPKKPIYITEVGWPSNGRTREHAEASLENQALFLRKFVGIAREKNYTYYICEAFDQPWKEKTQEGGAGAYWGVWDADRKLKFPLDTNGSDAAGKVTVERLPDWNVLAAISVVIAAILLGLFYLYSHTLQTRGRTFLAVVVYGTAIVTVWIIYDYSQQYLSVPTLLVGSFLVLGMLGIIAVILAEAHEWAEAHWVTAHKRVLAPDTAVKNYLPKVSLHVPAYNEPPDMLIETLNALAALDYPDFEVLVIDNNTKDENVWRPVEAHCQTLGARFRFFHVAPLAGFKAGALNFALRHTDPNAEVVAVIDSDYIVEPHWLKDLVPAFADPRIAIVQAPQDYRDGSDNAFKAMCHAEYRGFFHIGMITRNERNAIIQHGTMTMVRRSVLEQMKGWAEWCITEDAELGLRIFEAGYEATYLPTSYGRGVMPDTFVDFKKQRFRWAYGAMQILRRHTRSLLLTKKGGLTAGQRYHFIAGWLPWIADGFNFIFTLGALAWSLLMFLGSVKPSWFSNFEPPLLTFSILPLMLFTFKLVKLLHLYVTRVGANFRQTIAAATAGLALSHTIGMATLKGLVTHNEPFFRTPKHAQPHAFVTAVAAARTETVLMLGLWLAAFAVTRVPEGLRSPDRVMWTIMLLIQSLPYLAALLVSLASAFPLPAKLLGKPPGRSQGVSQIAAPVTALDANPPKG